MVAAELNQIEETAIRSVSQESLSLYGKVRALVVVDQETHDLAVDLYKAALAVEKAVHAAHDPVCTHWDKLHAEACANRKRDLDKTIEAKKLAKFKGDAWEMEQERIRLEAERKLQEEARRKAEEEARIAREAAEAERKRLAAEEEAQRLRLAEEAEQAGATSEQVTEILTTPLAMPEVEEYIPEPVIMPTVAPMFQKSAGFAPRWNYSSKVVNLAELVKAAANQPHFLQYLQPNESAINALARASKDAFSLPGCQLEKRRV